MHVATSVLTLAASVASVFAAPLQFGLDPRNDTLQKRAFPGRFTFYDIDGQETACGGFNQHYEYVRGAGLTHSLQHLLKMLWQVVALNGAVSPSICAMHLCSS